jgi:hypothetical protein
MTVGGRCAGKRLARAQQLFRRAGARRYFRRTCAAPSFLIENK